MKTNLTVLFTVSALALTGYAAQGGNSGGGGNGRGGGNAGGDFGAGASRGAEQPTSRNTPSRGSEMSESPRDHAARPDKPDAATRSAAPAAREMSDAMRDINQTAFAQRRELLDGADMRLKSNRDALKQIQTDAKTQRRDAHADFKAALDDVKAKDKELEAALKASRKADAGNWEAHRDALARADRNHADALARLNVLPKPSVPPMLPKP